jgi:hypothetical protein
MELALHLLSAFNELVVFTEPRIDGEGTKRWQLDDGVKMGHERMKILKHHD